MMPLRRTPRLFKLLTSNAQRMFKRFFSRISNRPKSLADVTKFLDDRWLAKTAQKEMAEYETDELCPSMYSFHSSPDEKNKLLYTLADCQLGLAEKLQSAKVAMVVDPLLVQLEVAVQLVLQLELFAALVADVETTVLEVHMVVQEDPARQTNGFII